MKSKILFLLGPSASGKSSVQDLLVRNYNYKYVPSYTTREARDSLEDKVYTKFISRDKFNKNDFIEYSIYNDNYYGTKKEDLKVDGLSVKVIEPKGLLSILNSNFLDDNNINYKIVYIIPEHDNYLKILKDIMTDSHCRIKLDSRLLKLFIEEIYNCDKYRDKVSFISNSSTVDKLASEINSLIIHNISSSSIIHDILELPNNFIVSSKYISENKSINNINNLIIKHVAIVNIMDNFNFVELSRVDYNIYSLVSSRINFMDNILSNFKDKISYESENSLVLSFKEYGVTILISKR